MIALSNKIVLVTGSGAAALGFAQRALEAAILYGKQRHQFGRAIPQFQGIQFKLAEMATNLEAERLLVYQAAWAHDTGLDDFKQNLRWPNSMPPKLHRKSSMRR